MSRSRELDQTSAVEPEDIERIREQGRQMPGVSELLEVYHRWRQVEEDARPAREAMRRKVVLAASDRSS